MPAVIRNTSSDLSKGVHGVARPPKQGSSDVIFNGYGVVRVNDRWVDHHFPTLNDEYVATGTTSVYANGLQVVVSGDTINCGDKANIGSPDIFIG